MYKTVLLPVPHLSDYLAPSDPLFDNSLASWAGEYFSSHGDDFHTMQHISNMDIEDDKFEDLADSFTSISTELGEEAARLFQVSSYRDLDLIVRVSMHDYETLRFDIDEAPKPSRQLL
ncbi:hypothetical protein [Vibrio phage vB_pir03]|nr:hypothetical protein [Vibrio phage vB_pir03]